MKLQQFKKLNNVLYSKATKNNVKISRRLLLKVSRYSISTIY